MIKKWICTGAALLVLAVGFFSAFSVHANAAAMSEADVTAVIQGIIDWKKTDVAADGGFLLNDTFLQQAGETAGDWFPIGLGRYGAKDDYAAYLAVITDRVEKRYQTTAKLHAVKATEWHRISLAVLAAGGDPACIGRDPAGQPINLIADGVYNRGKTVSLGRQGINGWIWGLIALDSKRYAIPQDSYYTREDILTEILRQQLADGGFALSGDVSDPDITAMAIQALAPYYNDSKSYTYEQKKSKKSVTRTVREVVDEGLQWLSSVQLSDGDFSSWGTQNLESTCQVTVALCSLGIDPQTDPRFIKNGNTLLDGMRKYQMADGGFVHSFTYDPDNPTALPDRSNSMASEQALYTWVAVYRQKRHMRSLYDFRTEWTQAERGRIDQAVGQIRQLSANPSKAQVQAAYDAYCAVPEPERCYVSNYWTLQAAMVAVSVEPESSRPGRPTAAAPAHPPEPGTSQPREPAGKLPESHPANPPTDGEHTENDPSPAVEPDLDKEALLLYFSSSDRQEVEGLPERLSTEQYVTVTKLLYKLENSEDFEGKETYRHILQAAKASIEAIQAEIDAINAEIREKLYPFDSISLGDKKTVDGIAARYDALCEYDRAKIDSWEDVVKTKTKIDNLLRGIAVAVGLLAVAGAAAVFVVLHVRKRRRSKRLAMEELAALYEDEDNE